jgi:Reverse transcriptase (RNA-dependent DNA polymerase)
VISSRDVYINEQSGWDWKKQDELEIEEVKKQPKVVIPTPNTVISRSARNEEVAEITRNGEASSSRSSGNEEGNENEEDEPRQL